MNKQEIEKIVMRKFQDMINDFWDNPNTRDKLKEYISDYIVERFGDETPIKEFLDSEIFNK